MSTVDALADVKVEGTDPFKDLNTETKTPSESPAEKETVADKPVEGGDNTPKPDVPTPKDEVVPFHKDPRWQEMHAKAQEADALRERLAEYERNKKPDVNTQSLAPEWFKKVYGDDPDVWNSYKAYRDQEREEDRKAVIESQVAERQAKEAEIKKYDTWVDDQVNKLTTAGKQFDRSELMKVMLDYGPTDAQGNFDFEKGYKILETLKLQDTNSEKSRARRQIADQTTKSSSSSPKSKDFKNQFDLRGKGFGELTTN